MIARPQPYRLDFRGSGEAPNDEQQLGTVIESADVMFDMLFTDLGKVEQFVSASPVTLAVIAAMITTAIAAIPPVVFPPFPPVPAFGHYSIMTNGYAPAPEVVFCAGDVIEVWVPDAP